MAWLDGLGGLFGSTAGAMTPGMSTASMLGNTGMFLGGAGSLYSGIKGADAAKDMQKSFDNQYADEKARRDKEDSYLQNLNF